MKKSTKYHVNKDFIDYFISEDYQYKTSSYYWIVENENKGNITIPSSSDILEAYIVPICLEKAKKNEIPVINWKLQKWDKSYPYMNFSYPVILYSIGEYTDTNMVYYITNDDDAKKSLIHLTNNGKYSYILQNLSKNSEIIYINSVLGYTSNNNLQIKQLISRIYYIFKMPVMSVRLIKTNNNYYLSSIGYTSYNNLSCEEKEKLVNFINSNHKKIINITIENEVKNKVAIAN